MQQSPVTLVVQQWYVHLIL